MGTVTSVKWYFSKIFSREYLVGVRQTSARQLKVLRKGFVQSRCHRLARLYPTSTVMSSSCLYARYTSVTRLPVSLCTRPCQAAPALCHRADRCATCSSEYHSLSIFAVTQAIQSPWGLWPSFPRAYLQSPPLALLLPIPPHPTLGCLTSSD